MSSTSASQPPSIEDLSPGSFYVVEQSNGENEGGEDACPWRWVVPYSFTFVVGVKGRWVGKKLLDVFCTEFPHHSREYYEAAISTGRLRVEKKTTKKLKQQQQQQKERLEKMRNKQQQQQQQQREGVEKKDEKTEDNETTMGNAMLELGDVVRHQVHRHELPALASMPVEILHDDPTTRFLVVNKPPTLPVHPCGRYHKNTVTGVLQEARSQVSGCALEGTKEEKAQEDDIRRDAGKLRVVSLPNAKYPLVTVAQSCASSSFLRTPDGTSDVDGNGDHCDGYKRQKRCQVTPPREVLHTCHRLDKGTSGVLILATSDATARAFHALMTSDNNVNNNNGGELSAARGASVVRGPASPSSSLSSGEVELRRNFFGEGVHQTKTVTLADFVNGKCVHKTYLARVRGRPRIPSSSSPSSESPSPTVFNLTPSSSGLHSVVVAEQVETASQTEQHAGEILVQRIENLRDSEKEEYEGVLEMNQWYLVSAPIFCKDHRAGVFATLSAHEELSAWFRHQEEQQQPDEGLQHQDAESQAHQQQQQTESPEEEKRAIIRAKNQAMAENSLRGRTNENQHEARNAPTRVAKMAVTLVRVLRRVRSEESDEDDEYVVECRPVTGRTHQIRLHLALLCSPITNDTVYNDKARAGTWQTTTSNRVPLLYDTTPTRTTTRTTTTSGDEGCGRTTTRSQHYDPLCAECNGILSHERSDDESPLLFLHAWRYEIHKPALRAQLAHSATKDAKEEGGSDDEKWLSFVATPPPWAEL